MKRNEHMERLVKESMERKSTPKPHTPCLTDAQEAEFEHWEAREEMRECDEKESHV